MVRVIFAAVVLSLTTGLAFAVKAPKLPVSAHKLTADEIRTLYDGIPYMFHNFVASKTGVTGSFLMDFTKKAASGTYVDGKNSGNWKGTIRIKGSQYCRKIEKHREGCVSVYTDGGKVYEVNGRGVVESLNSRQ